MRRNASMHRALGSCLFLVVLVGAIAVTGCGRAKDKADNENKLDAESAPEADETITTREEPETVPDEAQLEEPQALIETDRGPITIRLFINETPKTVENFVELAKAGYFDDITWHRVVAHFVVQTGDPTGTGGGGKTHDGRPLPDEIDAVALGLDKTLVRDADRATRSRLQNELGPRFQEAQDKTLLEVFTKAFGYQYAQGLGKHRFVAGSVGMANAGAGTGTSQFFIVTESPQPHLDGRHTLFGEVTAGLDVAQKLQQGDKLIRITIIEP